jgi:lysyl-tRNA synthetase class 2
MPDKMHGISDPEIRQRQRYADLIAGSLKIDKDYETGAGGETQEARELTTREVFERRSKIIREMRAFLDERGYIEVETPMLTPIASGAAARPFKTHHNALDIDLYARIAPELYLKRLVVGGFERVYELNRNFRNEGISTRHNPEFTMLEFYCAYMDVNGMMDLCEELLRQAIQKTSDGTKIQFANEVIDFGKFERLTMKEAIVKGIESYYEWMRGDDDDQNIDLHHLNNSFAVEILVRFFKTSDAMTNNTVFGTPANREVARGLWKANVKNFGLEAFRDVPHNDIYEEEHSLNIQQLFERVGESVLINPTFVTEYPKAISPLSKASPDDPSVAERFELFINGMECANGFSELNDPVEQYERFREQAGARERGDEEAMQMDTDYVRALAYGMPPAAGIGIGIDRIVMLLTNRRSIRDVILFPHMRPAVATVTKPEEVTDEQVESTDAQAGGKA